MADDRRRSGGDETFSAYVAARYAALTRIAFLLTGDHHAAEDLVQAALARAYLAWNRIRDEHATDAYVRRILVNEHTNVWRRAWRHLETSTAAPPEPVALNLSERDRELWDLVRRLPTKQRAALVLRYYEDLTEAETAEVLGCSVSAVKSRTNRAIVNLRSAFAPPDDSALEQFPDIAERNVR
ncbi:SigE family RNA polymerase sigma factor [Flindersiella endophytica]